MRLPKVRKPAAKASEITFGKSSRRFTETTPGTYEQSGNVFEGAAVFTGQKIHQPLRRCALGLTGGFPTRPFYVPLKGQPAELSTEAQALPIIGGQLNDHSRVGNGLFRFEGDHPLVTTCSGSVAHGATIPPGHMQNE